MESNDAKADLKHFAAERVELTLLIIAMAILVSVVEPTFGVLMYIITAIGLLLIGYRYYIGLKESQELPKEKKEILTSESAYGSLLENSGGGGGGTPGGGGGI